MATHITQDSADNATDADAVGDITHVNEAVNQDEAVDKKEAVDKATYDVVDKAAYEAVEKLRQQLATQIFEDHAALKAILQRHEKTIRLRWKKWTKEKRKKTLIKCQDDMPKEHRPDFALWRARHDFKKLNPGAELKLSGAGGQAMLKVMTVPFLNQEDMAVPTNLLTLLHSRGRHHPDEFIDGDIAQLAVGKLKKVPHPEGRKLSAEPRLTMLFRGRKYWQTYGEIAMHKSYKEQGPWHHPQRALTGMDVQVRILKFLLQFCRDVLHDKKDPEIGQVLDDPGPPELTQEEHRLLPAECTVYSQPSFGRIKEILEAERLAMEEHVWSLMDSPSYLERTLKEMSDHSRLRINDINGKPHPDLEGNDYQSDFFWNDVLSTVVSRSHTALFALDSTFQSVAELERIFRENKNMFFPGNEDNVPRGFQDTWINVITRLEALVDFYCIEIEDIAVASPHLRTFVRYVNPEVMDFDISDTKDNDPTRRLIPLLKELFNKNFGAGKTLFSRYSMVDGIHHAIQTDPAFKNLVTPPILRSLSILKSVCDCIYQLDYFQTWGKISDRIRAKLSQIGANHFQYIYMSPLEEVNFNFDPSDQFTVSTSQWERLRLSAKVVQQARKGKLSQQQTKTLREAENYLDEIWDSINRFYADNIDERVTFFEMIQPLMLKSRRLNRTPAWVQRINTNATATGPETESDNLQSPSIHQLGQLSSNNQRAAIIKDSNRHKEKAKTTGPAVPPPAAIPEDDSDSEDEPDPTISVPREHYKAICMLFRVEGGHDYCAGELDWMDFRKAMAFLGFSRVEEAPGSACNFIRNEATPTPNGMGKGTAISIEFHKTHPGKPTHKIVRRWGGRLNRRYGYEGRFFRLV